MGWKGISFAMLTLGLGLSACREKVEPGAVAPRTAQPSAAQRMCIGDGDCILIDIACNGCCDREAINKADSAAYLKGKTGICSGYEGPICTCIQEPAEAKCRASQCEMELIAKTAP